MSRLRTGRERRRYRGGRFCAWSAALALLLVGAPGCNDTIRRQVRQGALDVFETGLNTFYSELSSNVVDALNGE